ncbi:ABC transporter permease [Micromonospora radicis]|uniref:ABC transporter permease n=1 Tax=Micromonospora radicis TaxID=1894971 RepID=A0A418MX23_9ACTN|nr:ABC transporter permease [Micromonospora radicis]RIV39217.1 ABC transporter permease [Micromonospora radicis]
MTRLAGRIGRFAWEIALPIVVLSYWWLATADGDNPFFPPASRVLEAFWSNWFDERFVSDFLPSMARLGASYLLAVGIGVGAGLLLRLWRPLGEIVEPLISFLRSIPSAALLPFAVLLFGIGTNMQVFLITFVCVWPILLNTMDGVADTDPTMLDTARAFRIGHRRRLTRVVLMAAAPRIASGMRVSLSVAVVVMLISEMFASTNGIGYVTIQAQRTFAFADMWSGILMLGLLGYLLNLLFVRAERLVLSWYYASKGR